MRIIIIVAVALVAAQNMSADALALPGPAPVDNVIAEYDFSTGQVVVSYNGVVSWYIESASSGLTGDDPVGLPLLGLSSTVSDNDDIIGDAGFAVGTETNLNLGNVAAPGLPPGDLHLFWSCGLGDACGPHPNGPVVYVNVPEPGAAALVLVAALLFVGRRLSL